MEKIKINEVVDFRRKTTEKSKRNFISKLMTRVTKEKTESDDDDEPRDYWVFSTSCIYNVFKNKSDEFYDPKISELETKMFNPDLKSTTLSMYKRNRDILLNFKEFDLYNLRPEKFTRQGVQTEHKILMVDGFPLYIKPTIVFSFDMKDKKVIGALWLVPQVNGFKKSELGIFCEALYRFLLKNYSQNFQISEQYCIAIDTFNSQSITYKDILDGNLQPLLDVTINEMKYL